MWFTCGSGEGLDLETVDDVVAALDKHTLSNEGESIYQLVGAFDGAKFDVEPGGYRIEIYVYRATGNIPSLDTLETTDNQVAVDGNVLASPARPRRHQP